MQLYSISVKQGGDYVLDETTVTLKLENSEETCDKIGKESGNSIKLINVIESDPEGIIMDVTFNGAPATLYLTNQGKA